MKKELNGRRMVARELDQLAVAVSPGKPPKGWVEKQVQLARGWDLKRLLREIKRVKFLEGRLEWEFRKWRMETEGRLPDEDWPDRLRFAQVTLALATFREILSKRTTPSEKTLKMREANAN